MRLRRVRLLEADVNQQLAAAHNGNNLKRYVYKERGNLRRSLLLSKKMGQ